MARHASKHVSYSSRRPRAASLAYSPNWCPDITLIHGARDGNHVLVEGPAMKSGLSTPLFKSIFMCP